MASVYCDASIYSESMYHKLGHRWLHMIKLFEIRTSYNEIKLTGYNDIETKEIVTKQDWEVKTKEMEMHYATKSASVGCILTINGVAISASFRLRPQMRTKEPLEISEHVTQ